MTALLIIYLVGLVGMLTVSFAAFLNHQKGYIGFKEIFNCVAWFVTVPIWFVRENMRRKRRCLKERERADQQLRGLSAKCKDQMEKQRQERLAKIEENEKRYDTQPKH